MLSETDTRTIDRCRQVLTDLATVAKTEAHFGGTDVQGTRLSVPLSTGEVFAHGQFAALAIAADHALAAVIAHAATYLDDVHAEARKP